MNSDCGHNEWRSIGLTTICEPEIAHWECEVCGIIRNERLNDRYRTDPRGAITIPNDVWFSVKLPGKHD